MRKNFIHITLRQFFLALTFLTVSIPLFAQEEGLAEENLQSYFKKVTQLRNQDQIEKALQILNEASILAENKKDIKGLIDCYHKFALLNHDLGHHETTVLYYDRAGVLLKDIEYPYGNATHMYVDAIMLYHKGNIYQARYSLEHAPELNNDRNLLNNILLALANIYLELKMYDDAIKNYNALIVNRDIYEKDYLATKAYLGLAELYLETDKLQESTESGEKGLKLALDHNFFEETLTAYKILGETYEKLEQYDMALKYNRSLSSIKDSIFTIDKMKNETKTSDNIKSEFMIKELDKQEKTIEDLKASASRSEITAILTSAFLTIISLLAVSLYRNNQIKLKTNDLLQTKNNELQSAKDAAVLAMEAKTNFLSTVSHELRTPLYAVTGLTHLLLEENPKESQLEHLKSLKFSGDYLLNFINDILQINKIDADKLETSQIEFNLKKMLTEVIDSLRQTAKANNTGIVLDYDESIPYILLSDPIKLSQVFINLVGNALKFTKEGEVKVIAQLSSMDKEEATIYFEVKDTGIGISKEKQKNIFDSFEQGSIQINREYGGTGLGLTIVKSLLGLFESEIELESELGKGSTFYFEIKLKYKDTANPATTEETEKIGVASGEKEYNFKGLHLMVVEDNKINQVITKKMLLKKDITCDIANHGGEAIELAQKNSYDAILMDIHMPGIGGVEATTEIRRFDKRTPIIALTAISLDDSLETFYAAGCNDVVTKPFKPEVFYQKIGENIFDRNIKNSDSEV